MAEESKQRVHILRLFGMEQAALVRILREAAAQVPAEVFLIDAVTKLGLRGQ